MSSQSKYGGIELFNEPVTTGGANTNDWVASMRGMALMYADGNVAQEPQQPENPHHLEDFRRLVDVAARKRPRGGQTSPDANGENSGDS